MSVISSTAIYIKSNQMREKATIFIIQDFYSKIRRKVYIFNRYFFI